MLETAGFNAQSAPPEAAHVGADAPWDIVIIYGDCADRIADRLSQVRKKSRRICWVPTPPRHREAQDGILQWPVTQREVDLLYAGAVQS